MQRTIFQCDSCHKEADKMTGVKIILDDQNGSIREAAFHVCSEECIPTVVKMSLLTAKEKGSYEVDAGTYGTYTQALQERQKWYQQALSGVLNGFTSK